MASRSVFNREHPPRFVMVCGHKVKVKVVKHLIDDQGDALAGAYNADTKTIFIEKTKDWRTILWHEIIHSCLHLSGAGEGLSLVNEERITLALEYGVGSLFF